MVLVLALSSLFNVSWFLKYVVVVFICSGLLFILKLVHASLYLDVVFSVSILKLPIPKLLLLNKYVRILKNL